MPETSSQNKKVFLVALVAIICVTMLRIVFSGDGDAVGKPFPDLGVTEWLNSAPPSSEELGNKIVVLDFFASWCGPCMQHMPDLIEIHKEVKDRGVVFISLSDEPAEELYGVLDQFPGMTWPVGPGAAKVSTEMNVTSIPLYALYDPRKKEFVWSGHSARELRSKLHSILATTPKEQ